MSFKISFRQLCSWEKERWGYHGNDRDALDNRYGQKFINDHRSTWGEERGRPAFIHSDPELFYTESWHECIAIIQRKYISETMEPEITEKVVRFPPRGSKINETKKLFEIYVPTILNSGKPIRTRQHREWDSRVRRITGGLTIYKPVVGQWIDADNVLYKERMIPVRIVATDAEMNKIALMTKAFYEQIAVLYYTLSNEVNFV